MHFYMLFRLLVLKAADILWPEEETVPAKTKTRSTNETVSRRAQKRSSKKKTRADKGEGFWIGASGLELVRVGQESKLELRQQLGMSRDVFCRLVNVSVRAVVDVESGKPVKKLMRPFNEVKHLVDALSEAVDPDAIGPWFITPNEAFEGSRPIDLVERGDIGRLWRMVYKLRSGMPG